MDNISWKQLATYCKKKSCKGEIRKFGIVCPYAEIKGR